MVSPFTISSWAPVAGRTFKTIRTGGVETAVLSVLSPTSSPPKLMSNGRHIPNDEDSRKNMTRMKITSISGVSGIRRRLPIGLCIVSIGGS